MAAHEDEVIEALKSALLRQGVQARLLLVPMVQQLQLGQHVRAPELGYRPDAALHDLTPAEHLPQVRRREADEAMQPGQEKAEERICQSGSHNKGPNAVPNEA
eukprot:scaffold5039_cov255-Pinguiococcus_pyrenoidosus.AAC.5